ncbi:DMT family transporter [Flavobacterium sp. Fl-77]|uniref:DMT family transporter n=1 Tax=Flavobacterium flavipigmentatum TaxID=2893884 RepID=A0AAJ2S4Q2_9FLAO|nr:MULTISPECIES: DMT family transporter [unclassified Flavobacterium]MDX6180858.1 DMT family transporter [Flavobacterium sp. Fl-33]MDX6184458.1 DMT family transporter [Flavobacterium sp. Fl-77]UFH39566.1 DMT family transporter [Flavobacterium sp. F-70]
MKLTKPRIALICGILCISIFPILIKLRLAPGLISAFYRMTFAVILLLPYVLLTKNFTLPKLKIILLAALCGILFSSDVAVWNIAIQDSTATQASLLTNLAPVWVGIGSFFFLKVRPAVNFWIGTIVSLFGMITLVGFGFFMEMNFNQAFVFAILSGILYSIYLLVSKKVLSETDVLSFMTISLLTSSLYLGILCYALNEPFTGFSNTGWLVLVLQAIICQLCAWLSISYATQHMRATRVSLSLLSQAVITSILAWLFLEEEITLQMIFGGMILLFGIRITFYDKTITLKKLFSSK